MLRGSGSTEMHSCIYIHWYFIRPGTLHDQARSTINHGVPEPEGVLDPSGSRDEGSALEAGAWIPRSDERSCCRFSRFMVVLTKRSANGLQTMNTAWLLAAALAGIAVGCPRVVDFGNAGHHTESRFAPVRPASLAGLFALEVDQERAHAVLETSGVNGKPPEASNGPAFTSTRSAPPDTTPYVRPALPEDYAPGGQRAIPQAPPPPATPNSER